MPRSRGGSGGRSSAPRAPARPAVAPQPPSPMPPQQQQSRGASTAAHPPATVQQAPQQQGKSPGLFGQMASTAAGVAVGSSIGHAIGGMFGGGSSAPAEQQSGDSYVAPQAGDNNQYSTAGNSYGARSCDVDAKAFTKCMDDYQGNMQICSWYLDQLKACQQAAKEY